MLKRFLQKNVTGLAFQLRLAMKIVTVRPIALLQPVQKTVKSTFSLHVTPVVRVNLITPTIPTKP